MTNYEWEHKILDYLYIEDIPSYADKPAAKDLIYYAKIGDLSNFL